MEVLVLSLEPRLSSSRDELASDDLDELYAASWPGMATLGWGGIGEMDEALEEGEEEKMVELSIPLVGRGGRCSF